jgi:hypothetical protein
MSKPSMRTFHPGPFPSRITSQGELSDPVIRERDKVLPGRLCLLGLYAAWRLMTLPSLWRPGLSLSAPRIRAPRQVCYTTARGMHLHAEGEFDANFTDRGNDCP